MPTLLTTHRHEYSGHVTLQDGAMSLTVHNVAVRQDKILYRVVLHPTPLRHHLLHLDINTLHVV
jgi:hypothetical protein